MSNVSGRKVVKALKKNGWTEKRQRGDHVSLEKGSKTATVPLHKELKDGTLKSIKDEVGFEGSLSAFKQWVDDNS